MVAFVLSNFFMLISNVWALTTTEVCSALNKVRAMKLCMVLVWIVILILSEGFGSNTFLFLFYEALTGGKRHYFCIY